LELEMEKVAKCTALEPDATLLLDALRARVRRMGGAFLACLPGRQVIAVDATAIHLVTRTSARLLIYRNDGDRGAVLACEICKVP
jgi:hypothetical protein